MNEQEIKRIGIVVGLSLVGMAILNGAYRAGFAAGLAQSGQGTAVVPGHGGFGFFPFPPMLLLVAGVILFVVWHRRWSGDGPAPSGHGPGGRPPRIFEEWHRRAHEAGASEPQVPQGGQSETRSSDTTRTTIV